MKATVVIGSGFGDEGKGIITDYLTFQLCAKHVGRFNGGGQAGHTVQLNGVRHVHHSFNSGARANASTYLAREFVVNPLLLSDEHSELKAKGGAVKLLVHQDCRVSTVFDMLLNSIAETLRGDARHGSCGLGINETVTRTEYAKTNIDFGNSLHDRNSLHLEAGDFLKRSYVEWKVVNIFNHWVEERLETITNGKHVNEEADRLIKIMRGIDRKKHAEDLWSRFVDVAQVVEILDRGYDVDVECLMYEGAQGLMLDEDLGVFPHVTRSKTGLPNVVADVKRQGIKELDAVYVTRCYSTRHGAGPFGDPLSLYFTQHIVDETNVPNPWQGTIRYSALNFDELKKFIMADLARVEGMKINPVLAVTCLDQMDKMPVIIDGEIHILPRADFLKVLQTFLPVKYVSFGPERRNVDRLF